MPKKIISKIQFFIAALMIFGGLDLAVLPQAFALTYLTKSSVILSNLNAGGASAIVFTFTTSASNTGTGLTISFPSFTGGSAGAVNATQTVATTLGGVNCTTFTGATANLPGTPTASGNASTGLITFAATSALTASTSYCGVLSGSAITANPTAAGQVAAALTAGTDQATTVEIDIITNDQVVVTATVPSSFTMALSTNTDAFTGSLASGSVVGTTGITVTVNTNAKSGWYLWGSDANTGLTSPSQAHTIASKTPGTNATLTAGTEGYVSGLPAAGITQGSGGGTTAATTAFASSGSGNGSGLTTSMAQLASSNGTANGAIVTVKEYAAISATTPPGTDYADTITLVGAGSF